MYATAVTILLLGASIGIGYLTPFDPTLFMVVGTAIWAAIDSSRIELRRYKSGIAYGPTILFLGVALLWIVGFPWYLVVRGRIKEGKQALKQ